ncbi:MAG: hydrogenase maturation protease [Synergistaceae bacterium]|jgi:hydrogenase maturation protease|nr:hydrogenase maturation protease [Synergistaceae bacterium]
MKIWVAGFGNEYREDDGAGVLLASRIYAFLAEDSSLEVSLCLEHQLLPELAEELNVDLAIFCDADAILHEKGFFLREVFPNSRIEGFNMHSMGPEWLLDLAGKTVKAPCRSLLITVSGERFDFSAAPTPLCLERIQRAEVAFKEFWQVLKQGSFSSTPRL